MDDGGIFERGFVVGVGEKRVVAGARSLLPESWWPEEVRWSPRERRKKRLEVRVLVE